MAFYFRHRRDGIELGRCRIEHDELGYPFKMAAFRDPEVLDLVEGMEPGDMLELVETPE